MIGDGQSQVSLLCMVEMLDLQHASSSTSPKIHECVWLFNWEKHRVNIQYQSKFNIRVSIYRFIMFNPYYPPYFAMWK